MSQEVLNRDFSDVTPQVLEQFAYALPTTATKLIEIAGIEAAARLISLWPGAQIKVVVNPRTNRGMERMARLREIVGETAFQLLAKECQVGSDLYVPALENIHREREAQAIKSDYDRMTRMEGYTHRDALFELVIAYRKSSRCVEQLLSR